MQNSQVIVAATIVLIVGLSPVAAQEDLPRQVNVDWAAVEAQLGAKGGTGLRQSAATLEQLYGAGSGARSLGGTRPAMPVLLPQFAPASPGARSLIPRSLGGGMEPPQPEITLFPRRLAYLATITLDGASVTVTGSAAPELSPDTPELTPDSGTARSLPLLGISDLNFAETEVGLAASFTRFGVQYEVAIECAEDQADNRCRDNDYLKQMIYSMALVGGIPKGAAAVPPEMSVPPAPEVSTGGRSLSGVGSVGADGLVSSGIRDQRGVEFKYYQQGSLAPDTGQSLRDPTNHAPGMRFPIQTGPAFANTQVYSHGGDFGGDKERAKGFVMNQCLAPNYEYPWRENFCERRTHSTSACPSGKGHQGQDIRPFQCKGSSPMAVATENGEIVATPASGFKSVSILGASGRTYLYLHLDPSTIKVVYGQSVARGDVLGRVSNFDKDKKKGWIPNTTRHLHFEIKRNVQTAGGTRSIRHVSPYVALVDAYKRLLLGVETK